MRPTLAALVVVVLAGCKSPSPPAQPCNLDGSVACDPGANGWTCAPGATPQDVQDGRSYICSSPSADADGDDAYCCATVVYAASTCSADDSVAGCAFPSVGFSCTGSDSPDETDPQLVCSLGTPDGTLTDFCCCASGPC